MTKLKRAVLATLLIPIAITAQSASINLIWKHPPLENRGTGYMVQHAGESGVFTNLVAVSGSSTNTIVSNLLMGLHQFRVLSTNALDVSLPSNVASTNLIWRPSAPTEVQIIVLTIP